MNPNLIIDRGQGETVHAAHQPLYLHQLNHQSELGHDESINSVTMNGVAKHDDSQMGSTISITDSIQGDSFHAAHFTSHLSTTPPGFIGQAESITPVSISGSAFHGNGLMTSCTPLPLSNHSETARAALRPSTAMNTLAPVTGAITARVNGQEKGLLRNDQVRIQDGSGPYTLQALKEFNRSTTERHKESEKPEAIFKFLSCICERFVRTSDADFIWRLMNQCTHEEGLSHLQQPYRTAFENIPATEAPWPDSPFSIEECFAMSLELLVYGIIPRMSIEERDVEYIAPGFDYPIIKMIRLESMNREEIAANVMERQSLAELEREVARRQKKYASPTEDLEPDAALPAKKKATYFYAALRSRNNIGRLVKLPKGKRFTYGYDHRYEKDLIFHAEDKLRAEKFFQAHPHVSVTAVLGILDGCVEVYAREANRIITGYDPLLLIKQGRKIGYLLANAEKVAKLLDQHCGTNFQNIF